MSFNEFEKFLAIYSYTEGFTRTEATDRGDGKQRFATVLCDAMRRHHMTQCCMALYQDETMLCHGTMTYIHAYHGRNHAAQTADFSRISMRFVTYYPMGVLCCSRVVLGWEGQAIHRRVEPSQVTNLRTTFEKSATIAKSNNPDLNGQQVLKPDVLADALVEVFGLQVSEIAIDYGKRLESGQGLQRSSTKPATGKPESLTFPEYLIFARKVREASCCLLLPPH